jgi:hypothetical protein
MVRLLNRWMDPTHGKTQEVRLLDVFALGPFMMWYALRSENEPNWARMMLAFSGLMTSVYNGANYLRIKRQQNGEVQ